MLVSPYYLLRRILLLHPTAKQTINFVHESASDFGRHSHSVRPTWQKFFRPQLCRVQDP